MISPFKRLPLVLLLASCCYATTFAQMPELVAQTAHVGEVKALAFSPDGRLLASGSEDRTLILWEARTGRILRTFAGCPEAVEAVAFSPDGKTLAGSCGLKVTLWEVISGKELRTIKVVDVGITGSLEALAFSPDSRTLVTGGSFVPVALWDAATGARLRDFEEYAGLPFAVSPTGRLIAAKWGGPSEEGDGEEGDDIEVIKLWDATTGVVVQTIKAGPGLLKALAFSPDGKTLAGAGGGLDQEDKTVKLWDAATGRQVGALAGHSEDVIALAFSRDGKTLLSNSETEVKLWKWPQGVELDSGIEGRGRAIAFSPDNKTVACGAGLAGATYGISLWDVSEDGTAAQLRELAGYSGVVGPVAFSPDGRTLASGSFGIRLWDLSGGKELRTFGESMIGAVAFAPDGKSFFGVVGGRIEQYDLKSGGKVRTFADASAISTVFAISPDGKILASVMAGENRAPEIRLWEVATGKTLQTLKYPPTTSPVDFIWSVAFSPDGATLASASWDQTVRLWEVKSGRELRALKGTSGFFSVAYSPDNKTLAGAAEDGTIHLWNTEGRELARLSGHSKTATSVAYSPDGRTLASAGLDGLVIVWDVAGGKELRRLAGHSGGVTSVAFNPDGKTLASGGHDTTTRLWDVSAGRELAALLVYVPPDAVALRQQYGLVVTPDGLFDGPPASWSKILWRFSRNTYEVAPVETFFNEFFYPGLLGDIVAGRSRPAPRDIRRLDRRTPRITLSLAEGQGVSPPEDDAPRGDDSVAEREVATRTVRVRLEVGSAPAGARDLRLFRNGSLVKAWRGDVLQGQTSATVETTVTVTAGENRLTAYAFNQDHIKSVDAALILNTTFSTPPRKGTARILAIGINEYSNPQYNLRYAMADAQAFAAEVRLQQEKMGQYERVEINYLVNQEATKERILRAFEQLATATQPEDVVIVYFAGHGTAQRNSFYLLPHDIGYTGGRESPGPDGLNTILAHSISDRELERALEQVDAGQVLLVIDACNSGQALEAEEKRRGPMNSKGLAQLAYEKGMYVLTASQSYQLANETPRLGHGFLTYALVDEGLKQAGADSEPVDGQILAKEWFDFAAERVPRIHEEQMRIGDSVGPLKLGSGGERGVRLVKLGQDDVQRPRVFYRRELEAQPMVVAKPPRSSRP